MKENNSHKVLCVPCGNKQPTVIRLAVHLVAVRPLSYQLLRDTAEIDKRLMGICDECLADKNKFQRDSKVDFDPENKHLVYKFN